MAEDKQSSPIAALKKPVLYFLPVVLAATGPFALFSSSGFWSRVTASISPFTAEESPEPWNTALPGTTPEGGAAEPLAPPKGSPGDVPICDLAEVLRFDLTTDWIVSRWPRVSAGLAYLELQGYRVPLVTGTAEHDLAGALTYYFNPRQQLQRITFRGTTGNASKLVALTTSRFGLTRRMTNDPSVFVYEIPAPGGKSRSFVWVRPAPVVRSNDPYRRFEVAMVLERPEPR